MNDSDSVNEKGLAGCGYDPFFPASRPFVVSVGATGVRMAVQSLLLSFHSCKIMIDFDTLHSQSVLITIIILE